MSGMIRRKYAELGIFNTNFYKIILINSYEALTCATGAWKTTPGSGICNPAALSPSWMVAMKA
jgi:hypothetical protein